MIHHIHDTARVASSSASNPQWLLWLGVAASAVIRGAWRLPKRSRPAPDVCVSGEWLREHAVEFHKHPDEY